MPAGQDVEPESPNRDRYERFADKLFRAKFDELRPASADTTVPVSTAKSIEKRIEVTELIIGSDERIEMERTLVFFKKKKKPLASTGGRA